MKRILRLKNICKEFSEPRKKIVALNNINLNLSKGESIGLIGPSGSGKTTLLQIAGLLDSPTNGEIYINDEKCDNISEERKNLIRKKYIGFIYQNFYLLDNFSALENIIIPQLLNGLRFKEAEKRSKKLLTDLGMSKRFNNKPKELSAGEKQRVAILRAIANKPKIILADEPTGNLDKQNTVSVINIIHDLIKEYKISFIIATHNILITKKLDTVMKLNEGNIR